jgi:hypothetical protein
MKMYLSFTREEIQEQIPYAIVAETMSSSIWNTGKRKRLMAKYFTDAEVEEVDSLHRMARNWHICKGVPSEVRMTMDTYYLWQKLANFCCEL